MKIYYIFANQLQKNGSFGTGRSNVHVVTENYARDGKIVRNPGDILCRPGNPFKNMSEATRRDFLDAPCPECARLAERLSLGIGVTEKFKEAGQVRLFTTAPERLDRPRIKNEGEVGIFAGPSQNILIRSVLVPKEIEKDTYSYYQSSQYKCFSEEQWAKIVKEGHGLSI